MVSPAEGVTLSGAVQYGVTVNGSTSLENSAVLADTEGATSLWLESLR